MLKALSHVIAASAALSILMDSSVLGQTQVEEWQSVVKRDIRHEFTLARGNLTLSEDATLWGCGLLRFGVGYRRFGFVAAPLELRFMGYEFYDRDGNLNRYLNYFDVFPVTVSYSVLIDHLGRDLDYSRYKQVRLFLTCHPAAWAYYGIIDRQTTRVPTTWGMGIGAKLNYRHVAIGLETGYRKTQPMQFRADPYGSFNDLRYKQLDLSGAYVSLSFDVLDRISVREILERIPVRTESRQPPAENVQEEKEPTGPPVASYDEIDSQIPMSPSRNAEAVAVVIGNRAYEDPDIPDVDFAERDAAVVRDYLTNLMGYSEKNIVFLINADLQDFNLVFGREDRPKARLYDLVIPGRSDVFIYYSGHGAPDPETSQGYFLPCDCSRDNVQQTAYSRSTLLDNLSGLQARSLTIVVDACFSGVSDAGPILHDMSPVSIETKAYAVIPNGALFAASSADQISTWYRDKRHGLFTYFFLRGIRGDADQGAHGNNDGKLSIKELEDYISDRADGVPYWARRLKGREQMPFVIAKDKSRILVELR